MRLRGELEFDGSSAETPSVRVLIDPAVPAGEPAAALFVRAFGGNWRSCEVQVSASVGPPPMIASLRHRLDLSRGSAERRFAERMREAGRVRFEWPGDERLVELTAKDLDALSDALAWTADVAPEDWHEYEREREWDVAHPQPRDRARALAQTRRQEPRPARPVPYYAPRFGEVPPEGTPTVAGLRLPLGIRLPEVGPVSYWGSIEPLDDPGAFTAPLVAAFPQTGLWPLLWAWEDEPPSGYATGHADLDQLGTVDAEDFLRRLGGEDFEGLAAPSTLPDALADPFAEINDKPEPRWLLLVPCNRPADVAAVLDWQYSFVAHAAITALLRSWEERFGAVPVEFSPSELTLHAIAPPTTQEQERLLAVEFELAGDYEEPPDPTETLWPFTPIENDD